MISLLIFNRFHHHRFILIVLLSQLLGMGTAAFAQSRNQDESFGPSKSNNLVVPTEKTPPVNVYKPLHLVSLPPAPIIPASHTGASNITTPVANTSTSTSTPTLPTYLPSPAVVNAIIRSEPVKTPALQITPEMRLGEADSAPSLKPSTAVNSQNIWDRIRRGYAMPNLDNSLVKDREQWYSSRPDYIFRMTERSRKYLYFIVEELERRNMPTELALLPFVESAFNPQAVSSAKAAGMWQFMPRTGQYFDLKQNMFRDERRDVLASTKAALDYLQKLHGMFGDWHLALAAYNWGEGSVSRAIAKNQKAGLGLQYEDLNMPAETRMYVPKLQAVKNIISAPETFSSELPEIPDHPYFASVNISRDIDVVLAAKLAQVRLDDFKALNPSANKPVILAAGTPQILLPWDNASVFENNLQSMGDKPLASWTAWTAKQDMTVREVAEIVDMTESELREVNRIPPRVKIKSGSTLVIRRQNNFQKDVSEQIVDNAKIDFAPEITLVKRFIKTKPKDTIESFSKRYGLTPALVAQWNKINVKTPLKGGKSLIIYVPSNSKNFKGKASSAKDTKESKTSAVAKSKKTKGKEKESNKSTKKSGKADKSSATTKKPKN
jgi:membrane-bound lytic murein transglycosylase D